MSPNVQGPNGPVGPNYIQSGQVINNNNYYYMVPQGIQQDCVSFSGGQALQQTPGNMVMCSPHIAASYIQGYMDGQAGRPLYPSQECQMIFNQCDQIFNALYSTPPGGQTIIIYQNGAPNSQSSVSSQMQGINDLVASALQDVRSSGASSTNSTNESNINEDKIESCAAALHNAMGGVFDGTDEATIFQILDNLSPEERAALEIKYAEMYGHGDPEHLREELKRELSGSEERRALDSLNQGAKTSPLVAAIALHDAMDGWGTDEETVNQIMKGLSPEELRAVEKVYGEMYGEGNRAKLREDIKSDFGSADGFWPNAAKGAATGAAIGAGLTWWLGPGAGIGAAVGGAIGGLVGGIAGLFSDPSKKDREEHLWQINNAAVADW